MAESIFAKYTQQGFPYLYAGRLHLDRVAGGTPAHHDVAEAWIKTKADPSQDYKDHLVQQEVATVMEELGSDFKDPKAVDEAITEAAKRRHLNMFKRNKEHGLYLEGRHLKACLKEACSAAIDVRKLDPRGFGENKKKGLRSFFAEHVFVREYNLYLGVHEPTEVLPGFVSTFRGTGIQYKEIVEDADVDFTVEADHMFKDEEWAAIWQQAEREGLGANRSQGYGRFVVTKWELMDKPTKTKK